MPETKRKFIQITASAHELYALDEEGNIYKYCPAERDRYSFWIKLTLFSPSDKEMKEVKSLLK